MKKVLTILLILFYTRNSFADTVENLSNVCYTFDERSKIGKAITDLAKCQVEVSQKDALIKENMLQFDKLNSGPAFWQEPTFVWGGMIVSVSVGGMMTYLIMRDK